MDLARGSIGEDTECVVRKFPRNDGSIPIDGDAERVVRKLIRYGHEAYLVGGCVRDIWLEREPKDFDVATSATPNEIRGLFRNCRIIGRRFQLAHIFFGRKIIETSTFRKKPRSDSKDGENLLIRRDNVFGNDREDAQRRDFTMNGLFYNVKTDEIIDYVGGLPDLEARLVRTIGDPDIRFREDPVRMLRAIKFAARLGFEIEERTYRAIRQHRRELSKCAPSRVLEELYRLLRSGAAQRSMELLLDTGMAKVLWSSLPAIFAASEPIFAASEPIFAAPEPIFAAPEPIVAAPESIFAASELQTEELAAARLQPLMDDEVASWYKVWDFDPPSLQEPLPQELPQPQEPPPAAREEAANPGPRRSLAWKVLGHLDDMVANGHEPSNSVLIAAVMSPQLIESVVDPADKPRELREHAKEQINALLGPLSKQLRVARRDVERIEQVLLAQRRLDLARRRHGRPSALLNRDYFHDALTVYELTCQAAGEDVSEVAQWRSLYTGRDPGDQEADGEYGDRRRRRRRGGRRRRRRDDDPMGADAHN
jgi:poly(A) polymerase